MNAEELYKKSIIISNRLGKSSLFKILLEMQANEIQVKETSITGENVDYVWFDECDVIPCQIDPLLLGNKSPDKDFWKLTQNKHNKSYKKFRGK